MSVSTYPGKELVLSAKALVWKRYVADLLRPYLGRRVLEVGAGVGGTTKVLAPLSVGEWWCLEPDRELAGAIERALRAGELPTRCSLLFGTLTDLSPSYLFDTILYIDVLEHLENDKAELVGASQYLAPEGHLVVLSPAHQQLFSPFDAAIGHFRRYNRRTLTNLTPHGLTLIRLMYLDSLGLLASAGNHFLLRRAIPSPGQIAFWDKILVRLSQWIDPLTRYRWGKSILGVWKKTPERCCYG